MVIQDTVSNARKSKLVFGNDYKMYRSYSKQFRTGIKDGVKHSIKVVPVSLDTYSNL